MKFVTEKKVRTEEEPYNTQVEGIKIEGVEGDLILKIENVSARLNLFFYEGTKHEDFEYQMQISKEGISFNRVVHRPEHDHDDLERLCVSVDKSKSGWEVGTTKWDSRSPHVQDGWDYFYVPFGPKNVDY